MTKTRSTELIDHLKSGKGLPVLSPVALKLVELASDDTSSAQDLVTLIEKDPPLASRLLTLANSAFYHSSLPISTLTQAVIRVGLDRLRVMALSVSLRDTFPMGKIGPLDYEKFWRTSLYRAALCKSLATVLESVHPEEAFVAGLLMEIGMLLFFEIFIREKNEQVILDLEPLHDLLERERQHFGVNHREVGQAALTYWKFPPSIIACQDLKPVDVEQTGTSALKKICDLATDWAELLFQRSSGFHLIFQEAERVFGLSQDTINEILVHTFEEVDHTAEQFNLESKNERDLFSLMEKANRTLSQISERLSTGTFSSAMDPFPSLNSVPKQDLTIQYTLQAIAHEIRNPLTAVGGFARKLSETLAPGSEGDKYAHLILSEAERLENVLAQVTTAAYVQES